MQISVPDPQIQTALFTLFLVAFIVLIAKKDTGPHEMNQSHTNELKGVAILLVIFSHIGYFLFSDHKFLFPLSIAAGVGVNVFLFLSGFGLTSSEIRSKKTIWQFYKKRLINIFVPMWLVLLLILISDHFLLNINYGAPMIIKSFLGFFPVADIYTSINSPLWYFSLILFYYLLFPLVYRRKRPFLSIAIISLLAFIMTNLKLPVSKDVLKLYELHYIAFPLGMIFAHIYQTKPGIRLKKYLLQAFRIPWKVRFVSYLLILLLAFLFGYTAIHSGVGGPIIIEHLMSLITVACLILISLIKDVQSNLLITLGKYSYEIYLIQWPLMYRYDLIYKYVPAFLGTVIYIAVFILIGFVLNRVVRLILHATNSS